MTIAPFDKNLLKFLYFLVNNQEYMNSIQVSKKLLVDNKKVSDRTIRRWFSYLHTKHHFDYFPYINYRNMGLDNMFVIIHGLKNKNLLKIIPYNYYIFTGSDVSEMKECLFVGYCIPNDQIDNFRFFWKKAKDNKLVEKYEIMNFSKVVTFYSPFHKILTKDGNLEIPKNCKIDNSFFLKLLKDALKKPQDVKIHKDIIKNPFIIPIAFRYFREHWSSRQVWHAIKKDLGDDVWDYIKIYKKKRKRTDGKGIKFVQETMKTLHNDFHEFFNQIRITYSPFYLENNFISYLFLKLKDKKDIIKLSDEISKHCISIMVDPILDGHYDISLYTLTSINEFTKVLNIINKYTKGNHNKILLMDYDASWKYWNDKSYLKLCPSLFDPNKLEWRYNHKKYMGKLRKLIT